MIIVKYIVLGNYNSVIVTHLFKKETDIERKS